MKKNILLGLSIISIGLLAAFPIINININNKDYKTVKAAIDTPEYLTKIDYSNITDLEVGDKVFFITKSTNYVIGQNSDNPLPKTSLEDGIYFDVKSISNNNVAFSYSYNDKYISTSTLNSGLYISNNNETYLSIDVNDYWSYSTNDKTYYLGYKSSNVGLYTSLSLDNNHFYAYKMNHIYNLSYRLLEDLSCDNGINAPSTSIWNNLNNYYNSSFSNLEKSDITNILSDQDSSDIASIALAKYDYIIAKYGTSNYPNFLNRTISPLDNNRTIFSSDYSNINLINIITIISIISIATLAGLFFLKYKRLK